MTLPLADGRKVFLDFRKKAPLTATAGMYLDKGGNVVKRSSNNAHLAVDVPSSGFGLKAARLQYVTMPRTALLKPAIELAQKGFVLDRGDIGDVGMLATATAHFRDDRNSGAIVVAKTSRSSSARSSCRRNSPGRCMP